MATNNALNNTSFPVTIDPGASGDSYMQFSINGTGEFRAGVDDSASDSFKISQGSALGTTDTFIMTANGEATKPLQPAFLAITNGKEDGVTGDGTLYTVVWATEIFDQSGDLSGGTFTAPVTGIYRLNTNIFYDDLTAAHTSSNVRITTSNRTYYGNTLNLGVWRVLNTTADQGNVKMESLADMDAADTAVVQVQVSNGTKVVDVWTVSTGGPRAWFGGSLVC